MYFSPKTEYAGGGGGDKLYVVVNVLYSFWNEWGMNAESGIWN
jgi:hypothetical protein